MHNASTHDLTNVYVGEYMASVFYFCLKRTGNTADAEDLSSEIGLEVLMGLSRGISPEHFPAWVWRIARNRYARWAARTHRQSELFINDDIADIDPPDESELESVVLKSEEISLLNRELAFAVREHREIIIAHYIKDQRIEDIAVSLGIPAGTVKSRLYQIRKRIKEGFEMSRQFGKMSYNPERVDFSYNCNAKGADGEPYSLTGRLIAQNLLLAAYRTPSTAEELAIELGVAMPYIEDELNRLVSSTLMCEHSGKFETNFIILSAEAQSRIAEDARRIAAGFAKSVIDFCEYDTKTSDALQIQWHEGYQAPEDLKWAKLLKCVDLVYSNTVSRHRDIPNMPELSPGGFMVRPNGGAWEVFGYELFADQVPKIGLHGVGETDEQHNYGFSQFKFYGNTYNGKTINDYQPGYLTLDEARALVAAANGDISGIAKETLRKLIEYGYLNCEDGLFEPTFWVQRMANLKAFPDKESNEFFALLNAAADIADKHWLYCHDVIRGEVSPFMAENEYLIHGAINNTMNLRGIVLEEALRNGYLTYDGSNPEAAKRRMLGAYLEIL